jgi:RNA polymerase sigma factor (sigma-70 family)
MMRFGAGPRPELVAAARAGDRRAVAELLTGSLPLVYTIVRRALPDDPDVDDVVQDIMVRALRHLSLLRRDESFRVWLVTITVHQVSTQLHRRSAGRRRRAVLDEAIGLPDPQAELEDVTHLRLELSAQRRQVAEAGRWLNDDHRVVLPLWLLELAGELTRTDIAEALGTGVAHAGVRIQRMRRQLTQSRALVAALHARPRCAGLETAAARWDGLPGPLWRKRLVRHTRACPVCGGAADGLIPVEVLLAGFVVLAVPATLTAALVGRAFREAKLPSPAATHDDATRIASGTLVKRVTAGVTHPLGVAAAVSTATIGAAAVALSALPLSAWTPAESTAVGPPSVAPGSISEGTGTDLPTGVTPPVPGSAVSLESADTPGRFVTALADVAVLAPAGDDAGARRRMTFTALAGLADADCYSFQGPDGRYLRHASWRLRPDPDVGTNLFSGDATFCVRAGALPGSVSLESANYPGWFLRRRGDQLWVDRSDGNVTFRAESSFRFRDQTVR